MANSSRLVLPTGTAPAARSRSTTVASYGGRHPSRIRDEHVVGMPRVQRLSLSATGTPASGPGSSPAATAVDGVGGGASLVGEDEVEGVELALARLDGGEVLLDHLAGRAGTAPDGGGDLDGGSRRLPQDRRDAEAAVLGRRGHGEHLVAVERRAGARRSRSTLTSGSGWAVGGTSSSVERLDVLGVLEHGRELAGEELELLVGQVEPGEGRDVATSAAVILSEAMAAASLPAASCGADGPSRNGGRSATGSGAGDLSGEGDGAGLDLGAVVVEGGDVEAALEEHPLDGARHPLGQVVAVRRLDDVVLAAREQQGRAARCRASRRRELDLRPRTGSAAGPAACRRRRARARPGRRRREPMPGDDGRCRPSRAWRNRSTIGSAGSIAGLTTTSPAISGWPAANQVASVPPIERPATDDLLAARRQLGVGGLGRGAASRPSRSSSMSSRVVPWPGQQGQLDREPGRGERLGQASHRLRVAGEAVEHERAVRPAGGRERLGAGRGRGRGHQSGQASGTDAQVYGSSVSGSDHQSSGAGVHSGSS